MKMTRLTNRQWGVSPLVLALLSGTAAGGILVTAGCGSGSGNQPITSTSNTNSSADPVPTRSITVAFTWPELPADSAVAAETRLLPIKARTVVVEIVNTDITVNNDYQVLYSKKLERPSTNLKRQETFVFPNVPLGNNIRLRAKAYEGQPNASTLMAQAGPVPIGDNGSVALTLNSTVTSIRVNREDEDNNFGKYTKGVGGEGKYGIPTGLKQTYSLLPYDDKGAVVLLDPSELSVTPSEPAAGFVVTFRRDPNNIQFDVTAPSTTSKTTGFTIKVTDNSYTKPTTDPDYITVVSTPRVSVDTFDATADANGRFDRAPDQSLKFNYAITGDTTNTPGSVAVYRSTNTASPFGGEKIRISDVLTGSLTPGSDAFTAALTSNGNGTLTFGATSDTVTLNGQYVIVLTSADGTGRALIPVNVGGERNFRINALADSVKKDTPVTFVTTITDAVDLTSSKTTLKGPDGQDYKTYKDLANKDVPRLNATASGGFTAVELTPDKALPDGLYTLTLTRTSTGKTATYQFAIQKIDLAIADASGKAVNALASTSGSFPEFKTNTVATTFTANVSGLTSQKGVTWKLVGPSGAIDSATATGPTDPKDPNYDPKKDPNKADYTFISTGNSATFTFLKLLPGGKLPTGFFGGYKLTAKSDYDPNVSKTFVLNFDTGVLSATIK